MSLHMITASTHRARRPEWKFRMSWDDSACRDRAIWTWIVCISTQGEPGSVQGRKRPKAVQRRFRRYLPCQCLYMAWSMGLENRLMRPHRWIITSLSHRSLCRPAYHRGCYNDSNPEPDDAACCACGKEKVHCKNRCWCSAGSSE